MKAKKKEQRHRQREPNEKLGMLCVLFYLSSVIFFLYTFHNIARVSVIIPLPPLLLHLFSLNDDVYLMDGVNEISMVHTDTNRCYG